MKNIPLLIILLCVGVCAGSEKAAPIASLKSTPFATVAMKEDVFTFTLKRTWLSKKGYLKAKLVRPDQKVKLAKGEEILIYERHEKVIIRNGKNGMVTMITTFDGRSFGSKVETKTQVLDVASIEAKTE